MTVVSARRQRGDVLPEAAGGRGWRLFAVLLIGLVILFAAGHLIVTGAKGVARTMGVGEFVIGAVIVAVGTTVVRALESAMHEGELQPFAGETQIFIFPGYRIRSVDAMVTNFHLPESTLLMLVSAFVGRERILAAYRHAVAQRYRFFSYGDAMLLWAWEGQA